MNSLERDSEEKEEEKGSVRFVEAGLSWYDTQ